MLEKPRWAKDRHQIGSRRTGQINAQKTDQIKASKTIVDSWELT